MPNPKRTVRTSGAPSDALHAAALLTTGALQSAIFNSANFSSIATDAKGVIQIFNVGAERMLGYAAADVIEQDHAGRHLRSAGSDRARQGAQRRARHADHPGLRGPGLQGLARHRGHLRADLHPQGRQPVPRRRLGHGAARRPGRHHRLPADRHRQHRAQAAPRRRCSRPAPCRAPSSTAPTSRASPPTPRASSRSSTSAPSGCSATRPPR